jgi:hypothetical protein
MPYSSTVVSVGAVCFGIVVGYVTYRTLIRKQDAGISDIAAVIAAIGGGIVVERFDSTKGTDTFGWYSIGLLAGFAVFLILRLIFERGKDGKPGPVILGDD